MKRSPRSTVDRMDLSGATEIVVSQESDDRMVVTWVGSEGPGAFELVDKDSGYVDPEDVLMWRIQQRIDVNVVRAVVQTAYPGFDADEMIDWVFHRGEAERRAEDQRRRARLRAEFKRSLDEREEG